MASSKDDRPDEMWREGRPADETGFQENEDLYYRCKPYQVSEGKVVLGPQQPPFDFPAFSVNWSRYSQPSWVLVPPKGEPSDKYSGFQVAALRVIDIEVGQKDIQSSVVHKPEDDNYSHSEVLIARTDGTNPDKPTRKKIREILARRARVIS